MIRPIAITGIGAVSAAGPDYPSLAAALIAGRDGLATRIDPALPLAAGLPVGAVTSALPTGQPRTVGLALVAAREALADAGWLVPGGLGLALGSCTGGMRESEAVYLTQEPDLWSSVYRQQPIGRTALRLAQTLGIRGPLTAHAEACASAAGALAEAASWITAGLTEAVLVVGADALTRLTMAGFSSLQVVDPLGCRPFTQERAGMSLGEGACAILLEHADHARRRGARIRAYLRGWAVASDGHHATAPEPAGRWLEHAVREALTMADCPPAGIDFVAAHGTGTRDNDAVESGMLARLHPGLVVTSHKRTTGHTMGAAAAFGLAAAVTALERQLILPSAGAVGSTPMPGIEVPCAARPATVRTALVTSLAFGGVNAALILGPGDACT